ncbi:hypothetical protein LSM04_007729 [Trypanosoma melophagium]|uniref:uncharacterized protein n=1 Tax=Trypanosoma melophagium TaxID=715481 RepID=UPI00351A27B7|nr:hypothetical protein LSM04_007729 [Trypanosoma melophagium]
MEAVSQGAREAIQQKQHGQKADALLEVIGVTATVVFPHRDPRGNKYLTRQIDASSIMERVQYLISMSRYSMLQREGSPRPLIIAFRDPWEKCVRDICSTLAVADSTMRLLHFVSSLEEAMELILKDAMSRSSL